MVFEQSEELIITIVQIVSTYSRINSPNVLKFFFLVSLSQYTFFQANDFSPIFLQNCKIDTGYDTRPSRVPDRYSEEARYVEATKMEKNRREESGLRLRAGKYPVRVGCKKHDASLRQSHIRGQPRGNRKLTLTSSPCHTYFEAAAVFMVWLVSDFERERERKRECSVVARYIVT